MFKLVHSAVLPQWCTSTWVLDEGCVMISAVVVLHSERCLQSITYALGIVRWYHMLAWFALQADVPSWFGTICQARVGHNVAVQRPAFPNTKCIKLA